MKIELSLIGLCCCGFWPLSLAALCFRLFLLRPLAAAAYLPPALWQLRKVWQPPHFLLEALNLVMWAELYLVERPYAWTQVQCSLHSVKPSAGERPAQRSTGQPEEPAPVLLCLGRGPSEIDPTLQGKEDKDKMDYWKISKVNYSILKATNNMSF